MVPSPRNQVLLAVLNVEMCATRVRIFAAHRFLLPFTADAGRNIFALSTFAFTASYPALSLFAFAMPNLSVGPASVDDRPDNSVAPGSGIVITSITKGGVHFVARAGAVLIERDVPVVSCYIVSLGLYFFLG